MKETSKCLEYYLDSKVYNYEDVEKNIEETKKDFPKKEIFCKCNDQFIWNVCNYI